MAGGGRQVALPLRLSQMRNSGRGGGGVCSPATSSRCPRTTSPPHICQWTGDHGPSEFRAAAAVSKRAGRQGAWAKSDLRRRRQGGGGAGASRALRRRWREWRQRWVWGHLDGWGAGWVRSLGDWVPGHGSIHPIQWCTGSTKILQVDQRVLHEIPSGSMVRIWFAPWSNHAHL